ncbi:surface-adhesin E family protein [Burkholderia ubonensis]|uniref:surface-adhesin E family protein n=1 Tax=Burkholderia ubonensis TaxID=101571 RepID=UPI000AA81F70|nr:surface-adhesin E family protein [Burkholderia ubonensis]
MNWVPMPTDSTFSYLPESAIRIGDHVYLAKQGPVYRVEYSGAEVRDYSMQSTSVEEFDCAAQRERTLLIDTYRRGRFVRIFEDASRSYKRAVYKSVNESSSGLASLKAICAFPLHRERLVNIGKGDGDTLFQIDTRSVRDSGTTRTVWARIDYPKFTLNPPYGAPYDSIRELISLDCAARNAQVLIRYYFPPAGEITDATKLLDPPPPTSPIESDALIAQVAHAVCGAPIDPEHFAGLISGSVIRKKPETPEMPAIEVGPIPDDVRTAADVFSRALPGVASFSKATVTLSRSSPQFHQSQGVVELRPQSDGTTLLRESYTYFYVDRASVGGFAQLRSRMVDNTPESGGSVTEQLSATISTFADGATFNYRSSMRSSGPSGLSNEDETCRIGKPMDAATLNTTLSGRAWPINCMAGDRSARSGYYVEALRFFLVTESESDIAGKWSTRIDAVSIEQ